MQKKCSKCQTVFHCQNDARGCWCEELQLSEITLANLKAGYENCLCPTCLKEIEQKQVINEDITATIRR